ncbi:MAG: dihydrodipicolinate synthase family protein [Acidobacteriota bacterium]|nr:dihydrodipicolinate synthase family protein [Acidobacteriota bacterium]
MLLEGLFLPLTTPFHPDGRLNLRKLAHNVSLYSKTPAAGLVALGPGSEALLLSPQERDEVLRTIGRAAAAEKVLLADVSSQSLRATLELAETAAAAGFDAVLVQPPAVPVVAQREEAVSLYLQMVADRAPLPVLLASGNGTPAAPGPALSVETIARLAQHANVLGAVIAAEHTAVLGTIREATQSVQRDVTVTHVFAAVTGRMQQQAESTVLDAESLVRGSGTVAVATSRPPLRTRTRRVGFQVVACVATHMLDALQAGVGAVLPLLGASVPQAAFEVVAAWKDGDAALAAEKQERLLPLAAAMQEEAALKYGCDRNGYFGGWPRLPILPVAAEQRAELDRLLAGMRA